MIRIFIFVFAIVAYSSIGLVAFAQLSPEAAVASDPNVTVVHKTSTYPVVGALFMERCVAQVCADGIKI